MMGHCTVAVTGGCGFANDGGMTPSVRSLQRLTIGPSRALGRPSAPSSLDARVARARAARGGQAW